MDLNSGSPYWFVRNGLMRAYPRLDASVDCDVLVVGAGITGALIAEQLTRARMHVCVIDKREACWGSTSASTALLQYENDAELQEIRDRYGIADALLAYRACAEAIGQLRTLAKGLGGVEFQPMRSLYLASRWYHRRRLLREGALRQQHGFKLEILDQGEIARRFAVDAPVALLTPLAAQTDPYRFAHALLARVAAKGGRVHARTSLARFDCVRGGVNVVTDQDVRIRCKHLIFAAGYESQLWLDQRVARNRSSYAFVSEPLPGQLGALRDTLLWESARPYLYIRRTADQRILVGGEDDRVDIPLRRDARVAGKAKKLRKRVADLFPHLAVNVAFAWAGTFAETEDGLPFFGPHPQHGPRVHFAMAYGGNGITYSQIGAELLRATVQGKRHPCAELFSFRRLERQ